jgi:hypothetical protein
VTAVQDPPFSLLRPLDLRAAEGADEEDPGYWLPTDAPRIHVRGVAYKGTVEITTRPPERPALRR